VHSVSLCLSSVPRFSVHYIRVAPPSVTHYLTFAGIERDEVHSFWTVEGNVICNHHHGVIAGFMYINGDHRRSPPITSVLHEAILATTVWIRHSSPHLLILLYFDICRVLYDPALLGSGSQGEYVCSPLWPHRMTLFFGTR